MKKIILFLTVILTCSFSLLTINSFAQAPNWLWAKGSTVSSSVNTVGSEASVVATDASGNVYMAGIFTTSVNFGADTLNNLGPGNIFLTKYDPNGNALWAKRVSGTGYSNLWAYSVKVDAFGNVYMAGYYNKPIIVFDADTLTNKDYTGNSSDIFLTKYDANGNVLWAKSIGGTLSDEATSIVLDDSGNVYMAGYFNSPTISFDAITLTNDHVFGTYQSDIFLAKFNANGKVLWANRAGGSGMDQATSVTVDASGNAYLGGWYTGDTLIFASDTLIASQGGTSNLFLAKYNTNGNILWGKSAGCTGGAEAISYIAASAAGNIYVAGFFHSTTIIFGTDTLTNKNTDYSTDIFLVKYNTNGSVLWAKNAGGTGTDEVSSIALDTSGNAYVSGYFNSGTINFGTFSLINDYYNNSAYDLFLTKYNANGNVLWAKSAGGTVSDEAFSVAVNPSGNIYLAGWFNSTSLAFDTTTLKTSEGSYFLVKLKDTLIITNVPSLLNKNNGLTVYPNPAINNITIETLQKSIMEILNIQGQSILQQQIQQGKTDVDISGLAKGVYILRLNNNDKAAVTKIVKE